MHLTTKLWYSHKASKGSVSICLLRGELWIEHVVNVHIQTLKSFYQHRKLKKKQPIRKNNVQNARTSKFLIQTMNLLIHSLKGRLLSMYPLYIKWKNLSYHHYFYIKSLWTLNICVLTQQVCIEHLPRVSLSYRNVVRKRRWSLSLGSLVSGREKC